MMYRLYWRVAAGDPWEVEDIVRGWDLYHRVQSLKSCAAEYAIASWSHLEPSAEQPPPDCDIVKCSKKR